MRNHALKIDSDPASHRDVQITGQRYRSKSPERENFDIDEGNDQRCGRSFGRKFLKESKLAETLANNHLKAAKNEEPVALGQPPNSWRGRL
jgi:hypothetical protein